MSSLEEFGLDPDRASWPDLGICQGMDPNLFYDLYEKDINVAKNVDRTCLACPVFKQCFMTGSEGEHGVWGGVFWNGSGKPDKNKNAHKTEEVWDEIYERVKE